MNNLLTSATAIFLIEIAEFMPTINTAEDILIKGLQATIAIITIYNLLKSKKEKNEKSI